MTILVVDDEPAYRLIVREFLMSEGYDVITAENGQDALRKLAIVQPDIIISDVYMPGMDGVKLHRSVREMPRYEKLPFLFVSGFSDEYTLTSMRDPKYDGFMRKGRPPQEMKQWIQYLTSPDDKRHRYLPGWAGREN